MFSCTPVPIHTPEEAWSTIAFWAFIFLLAPMVMYSVRAFQQGKPK